MIATLIQDAAALHALAARVRGAPWIALDTEFMRVRTYFARLCLLQLATPDTVACVDPLAVAIEPLLDVLYDPGVLKVLHAARQDLEVLFDIRGAVPGPVFDTQIAAALCGHDDQTGYGALVEAVTGHKLPKFNQRADWAARPLSAEQLRYAEDDVRYLRDVYAHFERRLGALGRRAWHEEECAALTDPALYRNDPEQAWRRLAQGRALAPAQQAVLQALAAWRERVARKKNLPRGWVVPDGALVEIARRQPHSAAELAAVANLGPAPARRWGDEILATLRQAQSAGAERLWREAPRLSPVQQGLMERLVQRVKACATEQDVAATLLAPRREILKLALNEPDSLLARGWRRRLLGEELIALRDAALNEGAGRTI